MPIAVTGSGGQLGWELCRQLGDRAYALDRERLDITNAAQVREVIGSLRPEGVINTAAYTAVDKAEQDQDTCFKSNADAVANLADACRQVGCPLVQVSTDYVFGAPSTTRAAHTEEEPVHAQGVYARSKLAGEEQARSYERHLIVRTCGLYGRAAPGKRPNNFVETMLRLGRERDMLRIVNDQYCTPSYVKHVARAILFLLDYGARGTYHVVNEGSTNWHGFAEEIFRLAGMPIRLEAITSAEYGAPAPRPSYSVLDTSKYRRLGGPVMPHWKQALAEYLAERA